MQRNFISLLIAEKLSGKSRATLVRLCNKVSNDGHSRKNNSGAWEIDRDFLVQYYDLSEREAETVQSKVNDKGMQSLMQSLLERIKDLTELNKDLSKQNRELLDDNRRLLSAPTMEPASTQGKDYTPIYFAVICIIIIALIVYLIVTPT